MKNKFLQSCITIIILVGTIVLLLYPIIEKSIPKSVIKEANQQIQKIQNKLAKTTFQKKQESTNRNKKKYKDIIKISTIQFQKKGMENIYKYQNILKQKNKKLIQSYLAE